MGLDAGILMHPEVWVTSGHVGSFSDPLVECGQCRRRFRLDELKGAEDLSATELQDEGIVEKLGIVCPVDQGQLSPPRKFNLMFKTHMGPVESNDNAVYLRPETAQGMFINFENVQQTTRKRLPFGIAQIGKSFRNEITTKQFIFRTREFEQMEMEFFCRPEEADEWFRYWVAERKQWYMDLGMKEENLQFREHGQEELSHYSTTTFDVDYRFPWGFDELEGIANRTDFDLPAKGAHVLRHTLGARMVRKGVSIKAIADVLRHRHIDTSMVYTKVDLPLLREVALPWPGGYR